MRVLLQDYVICNTMEVVEMINLKSQIKKARLVEPNDELSPEELEDELSALKNYFLAFRSILLEGKVNFQNLRERDLAILRACKLNLGIPLPAGYTFSVKRLTSQEISYRIVELEILNNSKVSLVEQKLITSKYEDLKISVAQDDINVQEALVNLINSSALSVILPEKEIKKISVDLTKQVEEDISSSFSFANQFEENKEELA